MASMSTAHVVKPFHLPSSLQGKRSWDNIYGLVSSNFFIMT